MCQKEVFRFVLLVLLVGGVWIGVASAQITGQWEVKMMMGERPAYHELVINQKADGTLSATWNGQALEDVKFENNKLSFTRRMEFGGNEMVSNFTGTLADGKITGTLANDWRDSTVTATRFEPLCPALGTWDISFNVMDRDIKAQLKISAQDDGSLTGTWTEDMGQHSISKLMFKDGKLTFSRHSTIQDMELDTDYVGTITGNTLTGKLTGQMGDWQANGQRVGGDFIGQWTLDTDSQFGPPTRRLDILPDLSARYQLFDGLNPLSKVKIDGNKLTAQLEFGFGDQTFNMDFSATLTDGTLKGVISSEQGDTHFTGKKVMQTQAKMPQATASSVVGSWESTREGRDGTPRTTTLKIASDMSGTYSFGPMENPVSDLKVDGNQVSFKMTFMRGDQGFDMEFKGTLEGDTLTGTMTTPRGEREVVFKKAD